MVFRDSPNSRAACRMLMPSTCTARLMRAYTSTLYTSRCPTKYNYLVLFWTKSVVVYFGTATQRRSRGVLWSIIAPPFIIEGFEDIIGNDHGRYPAQTVALIKGLRDV